MNNYTKYNNFGYLIIDSGNHVPGFTGPVGSLLRTNIITGAICSDLSTSDSPSTNTILVTPSSSEKGWTSSIGVPTGNYILGRGLTGLTGSNPQFTVTNRPFSGSCDLTFTEFNTGLYEEYFKPMTFQPTTLPEWIIKASDDIAISYDYTVSVPAAKKYTFSMFEGALAIKTNSRPNWFVRCLHRLLGGKWTNN